MCVHLTPVEDVLRTVIAMIFFAFGALSRRRRLYKENLLYLIFIVYAERYVCVYFERYVAHSQVVVRIRSINMYIFIF